MNQYQIQNTLLGIQLRVFATNKRAAVREFKRRMRADGHGIQRDANLKVRRTL